jgi:NADPH:quinone reductase-like Zn-dependent oxidoreductase
MIARLAQHRNMVGIDVVRRPESADSLRAAGRRHVLCSEDAGFEAALGELAGELGAKVAFDAVGGELTARLAAAMPARSRIVVFGGLAGEDARLNVGDAIFRGQAVEGFWMLSHSRRLGTARLLAMTSMVQRLGETIFGSKVLARLPLEAIGEAVELQARAGEGKVLLVP